MANVERTRLEENLLTPAAIQRRYAQVMSGEFAPRLVINADGTEEEGAALAGALAYLDANHAIRLSVWDVLADPLMRGIAALTPVARRPFELPPSDRRHHIRTYSLWARTEGIDDIDTLLRLYRPTLLDAIQT